MSKLKTVAGYLTGYSQTKNAARELKYSVSLPIYFIKGVTAGSRLFVTRRKLIVNWRKLMIACSGIKCAQIAQLLMIHCGVPISHFYS